MENSVMLDTVNAPQNSSAPTHDLAVSRSPAYDSSQTDPPASSPPAPNPPSLTAPPNFQEDDGFDLVKSVCHFFCLCSHLCDCNIVSNVQEG